MLVYSILAWSLNRIICRLQVQLAVAPSRRLASPLVVFGTGRTSTVVRRVPCRALSMGLMNACTLQYSLLCAVKSRVYFLLRCRRRVYEYRTIRSVPVRSRTRRSGPVAASCNLLYRTTCTLLDASYAYLCKCIHAHSGTRFNFRFQRVSVYLTT